MKKINLIDIESFSKTRIIYIISVGLAAMGGMTYKSATGTIILIATLVVLITALAIDYIGILPKLRQLNNEIKAKSQFH